jgi:hypothetical protein
MRHVHVSTDGRDCDGRTSSAHVGHRYLVYGEPKSGRRLATFAEELALMLPDAADVGVTVRVDWPHGWENDPIMYATHGHETEEGFSSFALQECDDDCDLEFTEQRDYSAEAAGY